MGFAFGALALLALATALGVVRHRKPVVQALFLVVHLLAVAGVFTLLEARFLAVLQVLIYAGAVVVLIVFVIMLLDLPPDARRGPGPISSIAALLFGVLLVSLLVRAGLAFDPPAPNGDVDLPAAFGSAEAMGRALFEVYFYPFEVISLALIAALVGAVVLAKRRLESD